MLEIPNIRPLGLGFPLNFLNGAERSNSRFDNRPSGPDERIVEDLFELTSGPEVSEGLSKKTSSPETVLRLAKVVSVRAEIESGVYETPRRLQGTVERLIDVLA